MRLVYSILARYAELGQDGLVTMIGGGFHGIRTSQLPITVPNIALIVRVEGTEEEQGEHRLGVVVTDPLDQPAVGGVTQIPFRLAPNSNVRAATCLLQVQGLEIQQAGLYRFQIQLVGGADLGTASFTVDQIAEGECNGKGILRVSEVDEAISLRKEWMRSMGLGEDEIAESLQSDPPLHVADELVQVRALCKVRAITPSSDVLRGIALKF